jgi:ribosomal-protein-alanine N-acetyltransferase
MDVVVRPVQRADGGRLIAANLAARDFHAPWVRPFGDEAGFEAWWAGVEQGRRAAFLVEAEGALAGVFNLSEIVRGGFLSAYLGYYAYPGFGGQGVMARGLALVLAEAFGALGLHRVEANIQPGNARSIALARRAGFRLEGFSPRYLFIDGAWRDHERWAKLADD